jgi:hypothetical protein
VHDTDVDPQPEFDDFKRQLHRQALAYEHILGVLAADRVIRDIEASRATPPPSTKRFPARLVAALLAWLRGATVRAHVVPDARQRTPRLRCGALAAQATRSARTLIDPEV